MVHITESLYKFDGGFNFSVLGMGKGLTDPETDAQLLETYERGLDEHVGVAEDCQVTSMFVDGDLTRKAKYTCQFSQT